MYCEHCGKVISGEAKFCNACGKQIQAPLQTPPSVGRKKRTWWKWTLGLRARFVAPAVGHLL